MRYAADDGAKRQSISMDAGRLAANHRAAGSGLVVALGLLAFAVAVFALDRWMGCNVARARGYTLQPRFSICM